MTWIGTVEAPTRNKVSVCRFIRSFEQDRDRSSKNGGDGGKKALGLRHLRRLRVMKTRKLTIEPLFGYSSIHPRTPAAYLRLKGYWLRRLGFQPGDQVEVVAEAEALIIRKAIAPAPVPATVVPTQRKRPAPKR
ncbi:MAG TPA: SymE family type I addiction module toxin [Terrimicrobiaceae bacterium]